MKLTIALLGFTLFAQNSSASYYEEDKKECKVHTCDNWDSTCKEYGKVNNEKDWGSIHCKGKSCIKKCCKKIKAPPTCSVWAVSDNCDNHDLINKENIDFDKIKCKGEKCLEKCCQEPQCESTCESWDGDCEEHGLIDRDIDFDAVKCKGNTQCSKRCCKKQEESTCQTCGDQPQICSGDDQQKKPNFVNIKCKDDKCTVSECCETKPPSTCADWDGECAANQIEKPNSEDVECEGSECLTRCCKPKPPTTCVQWSGKCDDDKMPKPKPESINCKGPECKRKCCKPKPPTTCVDWTGECSANQLPLPNPKTIHCTEAECASKCCKPKPPTTCVDWTGKCSANQLPLPKPKTIQCKGAECATKCCKPKPPTTCADWTGKCLANQLPLPNPETIHCKGSKCKSKCCKPKPPTTCADWTGKCLANQLPLPNPKTIHCKGSECKSKCCKPKPPTTCVDWAGQCSTDQLPLPNPKTIQCKGAECESKCCKPKPPTTCVDWTGKCSTNQLPLPNPKTIQCKGAECATKCCKAKPLTCVNWTGKCSSNQVAKQNPHAIHCKGNECASKCCELNVCEREKLKVNGRTDNGLIVNMDDRTGAIGVSVSAKFNGEVAVYTQSDDILINDCTLKVRNGQTSTLTISPGNRRSGSNQNYQNRVTLNYKLKENNGVLRECQQHFNVKRQERTPGYCESIGDPHTKTIDGAKHAWGGHDYVSIFESKDLRIIGHHKRFQVDYFKPKDRFGNYVPVATYAEVSFTYKNTFVQLKQQIHYSKHDRRYCGKSKADQVIHVSNRECKARCDQEPTCRGYEIEKGGKRCELSWDIANVEGGWWAENHAGGSECWIKKDKELNKYQAWHPLKLFNVKTGNGNDVEKIAYGKTASGHGDKYTFILPDKTQIVFETKKGYKEEGWLIDIYIRNISPRYQGQVTGGVCGNWNGNKHDDTYDSHNGSYLKNVFWKSTRAKFNGQAITYKSDLPDGFEGKVCTTNRPRTRGTFVGDVVRSSRGRRDVNDGDESCQAILDISQIQEAVAKNLLDSETLLANCKYDSHIENSEEQQNNYVRDAITSIQFELSKKENHGRLSKDAMGFFEHNACTFPYGKWTGSKCKCRKGFFGRTCAKTQQQQENNQLSRALLSTPKCIDLQSDDDQNRKIILDVDLDSYKQNVRFFVKGAGNFKAHTQNINSDLYEGFIPQNSQVTQHLDHRGRITVFVKVNGKKLHTAKPFKVPIC
eukprot:Pgem_evm1s1808